MVIKYRHLMVMTPNISVDKAQISHDASGAIIVDDPESPLLITATVDAVSTPRRITRLVVEVRHPQGRITPGTLARIPLQRIRGLAIGDDHPNDLVMRSLITEREVGKRGWDDEHWKLVLMIIKWAEETHRPGGGLQAIADMWDVSRNPTATRWRRKARALYGDSPAQGHLGE